MCRDVVSNCVVKANDRLLIPLHHIRGTRCNTIVTNETCVAEAGEDLLREGFNSDLKVVDILAVDIESPAICQLTGARLGRDETVDSRLGLRDGWDW